MDLSPIQGLWIGSALSTMERLSIASFLRHGHPYHLYVYGEVVNVPAGTEIRDGNQILPASLIFEYRRDKSVSAFSNFFRYKLLLERGGWWADTDVVCLAPFDFARPYVFASEPAGAGETPATAVMRAPAGSPLMARAWEVCQGKDREALVWGEVGPRLLRELVAVFSLERWLEPAATFCPYSWQDWPRALAPPAPELAPTTRAVHLWHEMWRHHGQDKDGAYPPTCLYERLKARYLGR
jgi:hypothetical protein